MEVIKPKFELGQKVWIINNELKVEEREICLALINVSKNNQSVSYCLASASPYSSDYKSYDESKVFATKEELRKSVFGD